MYCSGCGFGLVPGQPVCPQCGRPIAPPIPPIPGMNFLVESYSNKVRTLGVFWIVYAALRLVFGFIGLAFLHNFAGRHFGDWSTGPWGPWFWPTVVHFARVWLLMQAGVALAAGWGLMERAQWGRFVALVAAFLNILRFPFGTALAIFTLVLLLGYRNNSLYGQLQRTY